MDLRHMSHQMFNLNDIKVLHIETTTACNAACPQCSRSDPALFNKKTDIVTLDVPTCETLFDKKFIRNLEKISLTGAFGDPAASKTTIPIFKFFRKNNPIISLGMTSNGGVRNKNWWIELANIMKGRKDFCIFSIDGLEDTNHIYRKNVNFAKVMENAQAFIDAGGKAHWDMLIFEHNEHQVSKCKQLAKDMGFKWFRTKQSNQFPYKPVDGINPPKTYQVEVCLPSENSKIKCLALEEKSLFVTSTGKIFPCGWMNHRLFSMDNELETLLNSENFNGFCESWESNNPYYLCKENCSVVKDNKTIFELQWTTEEKIN